jgi:hypothetical protein
MLTSYDGDTHSARNTLYVRQDAEEFREHLHSLSLDENAIKINQICDFLIMTAPPTSNDCVVRPGDSVTVTESFMVFYQKINVDILAKA